MPDERLTADELAHVCFGTGRRGDRRRRRRVVVFTLQATTAKHRRRVAPARRRAPGAPGAGRREGTRRARRLDAARAPRRTRPLTSPTPSRATCGRASISPTRAPGMLFETLGFDRDLVGINMAIPSTLPARPTARRRASNAKPAPARTTSRRARIPHWIDELDVAVEQGTAFAARDAHRCDDRLRMPLVQPRGLDRPDGDRPERAARRRRLGRARRGAVPTSTARGHDVGEIAWVSNLRFYGKCGATVSRVFQGGHLGSARWMTSAALRPANSVGDRHRRVGTGGQRQEAQQRAEVAGHLDLPAHEPDREIERAVAQRCRRRRA